MSKRPAPLSPPVEVADDPFEKRRSRQLDALLDHCLSAQVIADVQGEKFLSYMLAMTIQAARALTRR